MAFFGKKAAKSVKSGGRNPSHGSDLQVPPLEPASLRQNNISRLTLDERWTGLFSGTTLPSSLAELQQQMNGAIKREALQNGELERMEPTKKKAMNEIIRLTKEAFEDGDEKAREKLLKRREEIESINLRWSKLLEERDALTDELRALNLQMLQETARHVFATMRRAQVEVPAIDAEIGQLEQRLHELRQARERLALDWNKLSEPFAKLYGTAYVRQLETQFAAEIQASRVFLPEPPAAETASGDSRKEPSGAAKPADASRNPDTAKSADGTGQADGRDKKEEQS